MASLPLATADAAALLLVDYETLSAVTDTMTALDRVTPIIHEGYEDNLCFRKTNEAGEVDDILPTPTGL